MKGARKKEQKEGRVTVKGGMKEEGKGRKKKGKKERSLLVLRHNSVLLILGEKSNEAELKFISVLQGLTAALSGKWLFTLSNLARPYL